MTDPAEEDAVPISVRLGTVVAPEDPEDWARPLTWVAALGMLIAPLVALAWFWLATPRESGAPLPGTWAVTLALVVGAATVGGTQIGALRAFTGTLASALFAALLTIVVGLVTAGERQVGVASPTLAHAFGAAVAGLIGALVASGVAPLYARSSSRPWRIIVPAVLGSAVALAVLPALFTA
ncbi:MAG TPA: hypothetical protein VK600_00210 [Candidatus Saccharimonadales bacterium]|nr:hypothetical protein [Candidatus Saccharimonadales bacterium]